MDIEENVVPDGADALISRRKVLKRIGAGAIGAWAVPMFIATGGAGARSSGCYPFCGGLTACGPHPAHQTCHNYRRVNSCGGTFCGTDSYCSHLTACTHHSDCHDGWKCVGTCCDPSIYYCLPPCGHEAAKPSASNAFGASKLMTSGAYGS